MGMCELVILSFWLKVVEESIIGQKVERNTSCLPEIMLTFGMILIYCILLQETKAEKVP